MRSASFGAFGANLCVAECSDACFWAWNLNLANVLVLLQEISLVIAVFLNISSICWPCKTIHHPYQGNSLIWSYLVILEEMVSYCLRCFILTWHTWLLRLCIAEFVFMSLFLADIESENNIKGFEKLKVHFLKACLISVEDQLKHSFRFCIICDDKFQCFVEICDKYLFLNFQLYGMACVHICSVSYVSFRILNHKCVHFIVM